MADRKPKLVEAEAPYIVEPEWYLGEIEYVLDASPEDLWPDLIDGEIHRLRQAKDGVTWDYLDKTRERLHRFCDELRKGRRTA